MKGRVKNGTFFMHPFYLYRKVLLWRTLDIKIARTEAGIANKR